MKIETYKSADIVTSTEIHTNKKGITKALTVVTIAPNNIILILINDQFAQFGGYKDRETLLKLMNWQPFYIAMELYFDPVTGKIKTFQDTIPSTLN